MKKKLLIIWLICTSISSASFSQTNEQRYYYAFNEKVFLHEIGDRMVVSFQRNNAVDVKTRISSEKIVWQNDSVCILNVESERQKTLKMNLLQTRGIKSVHPMYAACGTEVGITDRIVMKFNKDVSQQQIDEIHRKYQVCIDKIKGLRYLVTVPPDADALEIANQYQLSGLVEYSCPDFLVKAEKHQTIPNDPYFNNQFYLHNTGQSIIKSLYYISPYKADTLKLSGTLGADIRAPEAWDITKGDSSIVIAVIDEGVTSNHPDLPNSRQVRLPGSNFTKTPFPGDDPSPDEDNHGNACAGIIAASHNDEGIAGIAPNCKIMPVRLVLEYNNFTRYADAITFAKENGADILSCSWGFKKYPDDPNDSIPTPNLFPDITNAIKDATENGRGGKGCVVVFSASNSADHVNATNNNPKNGYIAFPANVKIPGVLSVGASDRYDRQANYSPTSVWDSVGRINNQIIDVVAPSSRAGFCTLPSELWEGSEVWTIDIPGDAGYNPRGVSSDCGYPNNTHDPLYFPYEGKNHDAYTAYFGGTSAAAPQVAGVAALILSKDSTLTQEEVSKIIKLSARKTKEHKYKYLNNPIGEYQPLDSTIRWNPQMGYGVLDAQAAVLQAQGYYTFFHRTMRSFVENVNDDDEEISTCKEVLIQDVDLQGDVKFTVESGKRIVIKPPFKANPFGSNAARFYAGINQNLCKSPKLQSSLAPEAQRANPVPTAIIQPVVRDAFLAQNAPNPARERTVIPYYIPETFHSASLLFTTIMGVRVKQIPIPTGGEGQAAVSVSELPAGMYLYSLLVDGRVVATKRMLVSR